MVSLQPTPLTAEPPPEFLCPISGALMADPVIVPSGASMERACVQACAALGFTPPALSSDLDFSSASPLLLIPNVALKMAILGWCDRLSLRHPSPVDAATARSLVQRLMPAGEDSAPGQRTPPRPPMSVRTRAGSQEAEDYSSVEAAVLRAIEEEDEVSKLEEAMAMLRQATRDNAALRRAVCTPRLLAALRPMLLSPQASIQINAAAAMVNMSLEVENKAKIVRSGAVSPLVEVLRSGHPEASDNAAGAMYSLALEEENRAKIGILGAIPPMVQLFGSGNADYRARREAGMALYYVSLAGANRSKIAHTVGAVKTLLLVSAVRDHSAESDTAMLRRLSLMIVASVAGCPDGRAALMDGGAVAAVVEAMRNGVAAAGTPEEEHCIAALHGMSRGSMRFRGLARAAGAEAVLMRVAERDGGEGGVRRDMARRTLRAMRGEDDDFAGGSAAVRDRWGEGSSGGSVVSEGLVSYRRQQPRHYAGATGPNSTQF